MKGTPIEEFLRIVQRDLEAEDARILAPDEARPEPRTTDIRHELPGGRLLIVSFASRPADLEARARRVEMLVESFDAILMQPRAGGAPARPPPARSLHEELRALAERTGAHDAIVIDARSPVVWGAALSPQGEDEPANEGGEGGAPLIRDVSGLHAQPVNKGQKPPPSGEAQPSRARPPAKSLKRAPPILFIVRGGGAKQEAKDSVSDRALRAVRALPEMATLNKGGQLHQTSSQADFGFVARSFAAIYVLILAYPGPFDELRAKRAIVHALPIIERLVLALPPQDPAPQIGGVVALRPRLRRRR